MSQDKAAKNRRIAEALGYKFVDVPFVPRGVNLNAYFTEAAYEEFYKAYPNAKAVKLIPDFYRDEKLNALVLEAMKNPDRNTGIQIRYRTNFRVWEVSWYHFSVEDPVLMTAICEAFIRWRESQ